MRYATGLHSLGYSYIFRPLLQPSILFNRASSLSAIHRGLRRSEKVRPQGSKQLDDAPTFRDDSTQRLMGAERRKAMREARLAPKPTYKIKKGKKDITEYVTGPPTLSRKARFNDPAIPFGKKSLVFKLKQMEMDTAPQYLQHGDFVKQMQDVGESNQGRPKEGGRLRGRFAPRSATRLAFPRDESAYRERPAGISPLARSYLEKRRNPQGRFERTNNHQGEKSHYEDMPKSYGAPLERQRPDRMSPDRPERFNGRDDDPISARPKSFERRQDERRPGRSSRDDERTFDSPFSERSFSDRPRSFELQQDERESGRLSRDDKRIFDGPSSDRSFPDRPRNFERPHDKRRPDQSSHGDERTFDRPSLDAHDEIKERRPRNPYTYYTPTSIPYTTAASQFLYGAAPVEAALRLNRRKLYKLYMYQGTNRRNFDKDQELMKLAERMGVWVEFVEDQNGLAMLDKMSGSRPHNGYVLEVSPLPQLPVKALGEISESGVRPGFHVTLGHQNLEDAQVNGTSDFVDVEASTHNPLVLVLDQVLDPGNLGAILRTASFMGVTAVAISKRGSASMTPIALKASAGAAESLTIFSIDSPAGFLQESKSAGWKIYAAVPPKPRAVRRQIDTRKLEKDDPLLEDPCILLMGSEGEGLSKGLIAKADFEVNVPNYSGSNIVDSLNVSVATALLCSAFLRGKDKLRTSQEANAMGRLF